MRIVLPPKVNKIIETLESHGFEAFAVGGCVRDSILGREPHDWDITTSARPAQVKALFFRTIDTGIQHGTVTVMLERDGYEVTTYRIDGEYEDARHPKEVTFTADLSEDLRRRDFTINAMAYNERTGLVDLFGGIEDLKQKTIRCVGDAKERFTEDALRMLRAVRFSAQLGFAIEGSTREAIRALAPNLGKVSAERIQVELVKLLVSPHPEELRAAWETGLTDVFLPEFSRMMDTPQHHPHHVYNVGDHTIHAICNVEADRILRLTMLFHDVGKPDCRTTDEQGTDHFRGHPQVGAEMTRQIMRRLKFDNDTNNQVCALVRGHDDRPWPLSERVVRRAVFRNGEAQFPALFAVKRADILAQSNYYRQEKLEYVDEFESFYRQIVEKEQCLSLKNLAVTGSDLIAQGMKPGKEIGEILHSMLVDVLDDPERNTKEYLLSAWQQGKYNS